MITAGGGDEERQFASIRHGFRLTEGIHARAYAKQFRRDDMVFPNGLDSNDDWKMTQGGFRVDGEAPGSPAAWTVQGDYYHGFLGAVNRVPSRVAGGNVIGRWRQTFSAEQALLTQVYYDRVERFVPGQFRETRDSFDFETHYNAAVGTRQHFVVGLVARSSADRTGVDGTARFAPPNRRMNVVSGLVQDEINFADNRLGVTLGAKFENNSSTGFEFQPSVRAAWRPNPNHTIWAAVSRALRTPARLDDDLRLFTPTSISVRGDRGFRSEELIAYEMGYRLHPRLGWAFDLNLFVNRYDHLRSQERANEPGVLFVLRNKLNADTSGAEVSIVGQLATHWRLRAQYGYLHKRLTLDAGSTDPTRGMQEGNDPRHTGTLVSSWDLPRRWELDALVRYTSPLPNGPVPGYTEADLRLGWQPVPAWEFSLVGQNLLHRMHREFGPAAGPTSRALERSFYGKVVWRF